MDTKQFFKDVYEDFFGVEKIKAENEKLAKELGLNQDYPTIELNKQDEAMKLYLEAANLDDNDFITPRFLFKAANLAITANKKEEALGYLKTIKEKYESSQEGNNIDALIATLEQ